MISGRGWPGAMGMPCTVTRSATDGWTGRQGRIDGTCLDGMVDPGVMPAWLSGAFAAFMLAAVLTSYTSVLNSSVTLYVCDLHEKFIAAKPDVGRLNRIISLAFMILSIALVPVYSGADSIINLVQQLNGLLSMPILSVFIIGLLFTDVDARAMMLALVFGVGLYAVFSFVWTPLHYIHLMLVTLVACIAVALALNRLVFGRHARWVGRLHVAN